MLQVKRRDFIAMSLGAAAAATLPLDALAREAPRPRVAPVLPDSAWRELSRRLRGALLRPADALFPAVARPNNLRYSGVLPRGIAQCLDAEDMGMALAWCHRFGVELAIRAGGHSYAGYSTTRGLLIDVSPMKAAQYDQDSGVIRVGGGCSNADVYAALKKANRTITHGRCPTVGAAAFLLGGGIGFNMRQYGMACDHLVASEILLPDGSPARLDARRNADLFWACRGGGGGNFGISTSFSLQTFPAENVTVFHIIWEKASRDLSLALLEALGAGPDTLGSRVSLQADNKGGVTIDLIGQLKGSEQELSAILQRAYTQASPSTARIHTMEYWDGQEFLAEGDDPSYYQERSGYMHAQRLATDLLDKGFAWLQKAPLLSGVRDLRFFQTGGAIKRMRRDETAYVHRDYDWLVVVGLYWGEQDNRDADLVRKAHDWQDGFYADVSVQLDGAYQNFPDPSLTDWRKAYYRENQARLEHIKARVDPRRVFRFAQGI